MHASLARLVMAGACCVAGFVVTSEPGARGWCLGSVGVERTALAQADADLAAARKLFGEALADEQAGRYAAALEKFQRVQAVRDTQAVRYRVATCLEAMGQLRSALAMYGTTSIAASTDAESTGIARASRDKVDALSKRVAHVTVTLSARAPTDAVVKIDGETVPPNALGTPIVVDPGAHEITGTGTAAAPYRAQTTLPEGGKATVEVQLASQVAPPAVVAPVAPSPPPPPPRMAEPAAEPRATEEPTQPHAGRTTAGVVGVTAGGILLAGSATLLLVRHSDIMSLEAACAGGTCPLSRRTSSRPLVTAR